MHSRCRSLVLRRFASRLRACCVPFSITPLLLVAGQGWAWLSSSTSAQWQVSEHHPGSNWQKPRVNRHLPGGTLQKPRVWRGRQKILALHYQPDPELAMLDNSVALDDFVLPSIQLEGAHREEDHTGHEFFMQPFWKLADTLNFFSIGVLNTMQALHFDRAVAGTLPPVAFWHAGLWTCLNVLLSGATLSSLLLVAVQARDGVDGAKKRRVVWLGTESYLWALFGLLLTVAAQVSGCIQLFSSTPWCWLMVVNCSCILVSALLHSGWFSTPGLRMPLRLLGAFLYTFGGGLWRDLLCGMLPASLVTRNLSMMLLGLMVCRCFHRKGETWTLVAGLPVVTGIFAVFAFA
eukprot:TRINITY_DN24682_c0_g1_i1.p1 TRINITY_DN24682_c0_g1~~TRINITY_DN24682_c0_g1_i1.p1  ORF type:complete len:348 (+),score=40.12 TRINITY_DN24682_c0_g1_i1:104-1147(+)